MEDNMRKTNFEYLNVDSIDDELKCAICFGPFMSPVCDSQCGHTFCQQCIKEWLTSSSRCPTCREHVLFSDYTPVKTRAVLNQLSRFHIKCNLCRQINIQDTNKHLQICPKQLIKCPSANIQCQWEGKREKLGRHLQTCPFQQIQPIIDQLINEIKIIRETQCDQQRFIKAFINDGYTLSHDCVAPHCYLNRPRIGNKSHFIPCSLCNTRTNVTQIALHSCVMNNCICKPCLDKSTEQLPQLTRKRKLSFSEESDDGSGYVSSPTYTPSS